MYRLLKELFYLLTPKQRKRFIKLQFLVIIMTFAEIAGVASIGPFMAMVGSVDILNGDNLLARIYQQTGLSNPHDFIFVAGLLVITMLAISAIISMFTIWRLALFATKVGAEIADRLFSHYMHQPWLFHASGNSAQLIKNISTESGRVITGVIQPLVTMNAKAILAFFMSLSIFIFNPKVAVIGVLIFGVAYVILFRFVRGKLVKNGNVITDSMSQRFKLMSEGFGGVKDVLLLGRQEVFINRFKENGIAFSYCQGSNQGIVQVPRYMMELLAFGTVITLILYLVKSYDGNLGAVLPVLSLYALAGFKLLPAFQQMFGSLAQIKGNLSAFEAIRDDLKASLPIASHEKVRVVNSDKLELVKSIKLQNIEFTYPSTSEPVLQGVSLDIPANKVVGFVGASGSGKSTIIDLILGLVLPDKGEILIDGQPLTSSNLRAWQNTLGFVPQSIFLSDASILENIAFGLPLECIDTHRVNEVIKLAHLNELITQLPEGLNTRVGERGVQLSGGQRQRIGIARSLYADAQTLILDEATSALDGITERLIMDAIHDFSDDKTIIMIAHRLATVKECDIIYLIDKGVVVDQGSYEELSVRNETFKRMSDFS